MNRLQIVCAVFLVTAPLATSAHALTIDNSSASTGSAANFGDPDDKVPYPHLDDNGQPSNFQGGMQPVGNSGVSFGIHGNSDPSSNGSPDDAFRRAQQNQQQ